jgi:plastocyanin
MRISHLLVSGIAVLLISVGGRELAGGGTPIHGPAPVGNAVLKGIVKFEGTAPKAARINMSADPDCAKLHTSGASSEDIVTDSNGGVENVIVFVSNGLGDQTFDPPSQPMKIEQKGCMYEPHVVAVRASQELEVINEDKTTHNIHPLPRNNPEWNKSEPPGLSFEVSFPRQEIAIPVKCNIHPWMKTYIAVFKHPYFVLTGKNGSFEMDNLPPGNYTLEAWHEKLGTATQQITIGGAETKEVKFVFKKVPNF